MIKEQNLDKSVKPQDNFFQFANGGWLKNNPIPPSENRWGTFLELRETNWQRLHLILEDLSKNTALENNLDKQLRDFYLSAVDPKKPCETGIKLLEEYLNGINKSENVRQLMSCVYKLQGLDLSVPWCQYVDVNDKDSTKYVFRIRQGGLGLPDRDYYFKEDEIMQKIREEYKKHISRMFALANSSCTEETINNIWQIEQTLAESSMTSTECRDIEAQYNLFPTDELAKLVKLIDWTEYFKQISLTEKEIIVDQPKFFSALGRILEEQNLLSLKNYFSWHIIRLFSSYLGEEFEENNFEFYGRVINGTKELQPRWKRVVMQMDHAIGEGLGQKFVEKYFPPKAVQRMEVLIEDLRSAFSKRIDKLDWMSAESKVYAQEKLKKLKIKIGYPNSWRDYSKMKINDLCYLENALEASRFELERNINNLGKPIDKDEWHMTPQTVNAYANYNMNEIVFPAGILQDPFFSFENDDAENYGGIGCVIGHEITHGFDDKGSQFDADGNFRSWRAETDEINFNTRAAVLEKQASDFSVLEGLKINGQLTLGENIGDLGGVEMALDAFEESLKRNQLENKEGFTPKQRFFLSFARSEAEATREERLRNQILTDPHSPAIFRCNGIVRNVDRFYEEFQVGAQDGMYLEQEKRARIW